MKQAVIIKMKKSKNGSWLKYFFAGILFVLPLLGTILFINKTYPVLSQLLQLFTGWLTWTYGEYLWHRFKTHAKNEQPGKVYQRHMYHHQHPAQLKIQLPHRVFMMIGMIVFGIISIRLNNYFTLFTGFYTGFVWFCYMHVVLHRRWSMKIFPRLFRYHVQHHCKHPDKCFGVSVPWWDDVFGTAPSGSYRIPARIIDFYFDEKDHQHAH